MGAVASQITSLKIVYSTVYSDVDQRKHQSSESLAFVRGIHRGPVNSPHKWPVTRKTFPFDDVIMGKGTLVCWVPLYIRTYRCIVSRVTTRYLSAMDVDKIELVYQYCNLICGTWQTKWSVEQYTISTAKYIGQHIGSVGKYGAWITIICNIS